MAIDDILDEHEQSERVLDWLRRNGAGLIGGIVLGLAAIAGWKWWQQREQQMALQAATRYQSTIDGIQASDAQAAVKVKDLGANTYGALATLELARSQVAAGQRDAAIATLRALRPEDPALTEIANQRLARLLIDADQADAALKLAGTANTSTALELRGDVHFALDQRDKARQAYSQALARLDVASPQRRLLELKLTQVGGNPIRTEAPL